MRPFIIFISLLLTTCGSTFSDKHRVNKDYVAYIEIRKLSDTVSLRLTADQATGFVDKWNNAGAKGLYKFLPEYSVTIHFKADSTLSFRTNRDLIKQRSDFAYSVGNGKYFQKIWYKQAGLPDNWSEYMPMNENEGKFSQDRNGFDENHKVGIKQVLTYYGHKFKDIRGQIFYEGKIDDELLWNYTMKANDSIWLNSHR